MGKYKHFSGIGEEVVLLSKDGVRTTGYFAGIETQPFRCYAFAREEQDGSLAQLLIQTNNIKVEIEGERKLVSPADWIWEGISWHRSGDATHRRLEEVIDSGRSNKSTARKETEEGS